MYVILPPKWHQLPFTLEFYFTRTSCWLVQAYTSITVYGWGELFSVNVDKHCSFTKQHAAYLIRCLWFQNTARIFAHIFEPSSVMAKEFYGVGPRTRSRSRLNARRGRPLCSCKSSGEASETRAKPPSRWVICWQSVWPDWAIYYNLGDFWN